MMTKGFYKRDRSIYSRFIQGNCGFYEAGVHDYLSAKANPFTNGTNPPGVWLGSVRLLAEEFGEPRRAVEAALKRLESCEMIRRFAVGGPGHQTAFLVDAFEVATKKGVVRVNAAKTQDWRAPCLMPTSDGDEASFKHQEEPMHHGPSAGVIPHQVATAMTPAPVHICTSDASYPNHSAALAGAKEVLIKLKHKEDPPLEARLPNAKTSNVATFATPSTSKVVAPDQGSPVPFHALDFAFQSTNGIGSIDPDQLRRTVMWGWQERFWAPKLRQVQSEEALTRLLKSIGPQVPEFYRVPGWAEADIVGQADKQCQLCGGVGSLNIPNTGYPEHLGIQKSVECSCVQKSSTPWRRSF